VQGAVRLARELDLPLVPAHVVSPEGDEAAADLAEVTSEGRMTVRSHQTVRLAPGKHAGPDDGVCVMELASMRAREPFSDRPRTVCPVIAAFLRSYNDGLDDARRNDLCPFAATAVGTRRPRASSRSSPG
jgi:hypothetical protein